MSLQSIIWVFLLNNFSRVINLLLTKLAPDRPGRISALGFYCTDLAALGPYCQDLGPIFSQYGPCAWLIRYIYYHTGQCTLNLFPFHFHFSFKEPSQLLQFSMPLKLLHGEAQVMFLKVCLINLKGSFTVIVDSTDNLI